MALLSLSVAGRGRDLVTTKKRDSVSDRHSYKSPAKNIKTGRVMKNKDMKAKTVIPLIIQQTAHWPRCSEMRK